MAIFGIMLQDEMNDSPYTFPICEKAESADDLRTIDSLNVRVRMRLNKSTYECTVIEPTVSYQLVEEQKAEIGGIYRFDLK